VLGGLLSSDGAAEMIMIMCDNYIIIIDHVMMVAFFFKKNDMNYCPGVKF